jgi:hypothetical protein
MSKSAKFKLIAVLLVIALASGMLFAFTACIKELYEFNFEIINYQIPQNLPEHQLALRWYNERGEEVDFNPSRPSAIVFGGFDKFDAKENLVLPLEAYNANRAGEINNRALRLGLIAANQRNAMPSYWRRVLGFNIGVFHYEAFADDTAENLANKVFDKSAMSYIDKNGEPHTGGLDFNLTDAFVMEWLRLMFKSPIGGTATPNRPMEVRFIGDGAGALLAINAANALKDIFAINYENISGSFLPNRISLTSPYFGEHIVEASQKVEKLGNFGCVFVLIENEEATESDKINYYNIIKDMSAYLFLRETFSDKYPDDYKELNRAVRDWYLYSAGGSDDTAASTPQSQINGWQDSYPTRDDRTNMSTTLPYYGVSAWTPTVYLRAVRGATFNMIQYTWVQNAAQQALDYTLNRFASETFQVSDLTNIFSTDEAEISRGVLVVGYVFESLDGTVFINNSFDARLAGVEVNVEISLAGGSTRNFSVRTGEDGFYSFVMRMGEYSNSHRVTVIPPDRALQIMPIAPSEIAPNEFTRLHVSRIGSGGESFTAFIQDAADVANAPRNRFQIVVRNCGLVRI